MTHRLSIEELRLGPVQTLDTLSPDTPPPFDFEKDLGLIPPKALPITYINPKLDTNSYWGMHPTAGLQ